MIQEEIKLKLSKTSGVIVKIAAVAAAVTAIGAGYAFYINFLWKPYVEVLEVDFVKGTARIKHGKLFPEIINITGETIYQIAGDWGIRIGSVLNSGGTKYNRVELVRKQMVVEYLTK
jgi:hypothetical protein